MERCVRHLALALVVSGLLLANLPGIVSARRSGVSLRQQTGPSFVFPSDGTVLPYNGALTFQVQPINGATGYLWSFVQNGGIAWQNLDSDGSLSPNTYTMKPGGRAHNSVRPGALQVRVRAQLGSNRWTAANVITVRLQGSASPQPPGGGTPAGTILQPGQTWKQNGLTVLVQHPIFGAGCRAGQEVGLYFDLILHNTTANQLVINFQGQSDLSVTDNLGNTYSGDNVKDLAQNDCFNSGSVDNLNLYSLQPGEQQQHTIAVYGTQNPDRSYYTVEIVQAGRIQHARWRINIPK